MVAPGYRMREVAPDKDRLPLTSSSFVNVDAAEELVAACSAPVAPAATVLTAPHFLMETPDHLEANICLERRLFLSHSVSDEVLLALTSVEFDLGEPGQRLVGQGSLGSSALEVLREREGQYLYWDEQFSGFGIEPYVWD